MGIKERRTKVLLSIFFMSDVSFSAVDIDETAQKIFDIALNQKTKSTINILAKEGAIEKINNEATKVILTDKGFEELCFTFPSFRYMKTKWDGVWRILSYEIPEKKRELRDKLRREVAGWGLGPWHRSFWLTPHPVITQLKKLISQKEEEQYVQAFESQHVFGDKNILIEKVWQISNLDKQYRELFKKWHDALSQEKPKLDKMKLVVDTYVDVLRLDPGLPAELIGSKWIGFEAFTIFKEVRSILLSKT